MTHLRLPRQLPSRTAGWLGLPLLLSLTAPLACAWTSNYAEPVPPQPLPAPTAQATVAAPVNLAGYVQLALQRQPRLAVERANLAAAEDGKQALDNLKLAIVVEHDIPIRRRQACLGISAAVAGLDQAERETVYAVTRAYFTVLYAREQEAIARSVVERLSATNDAAQKALKEGARRDLTAADVNRSLVYLRQAEARRIQAAQGVKRALASLKEACGLDANSVLEVPAGRLPDPSARPASREDVIALALARRGELVQASVFAQITCLEVEAQGTSVMKRKETFAAGSDIHSTQVAQGNRGSDYKPGAVPPAMPTLLVGSRSERVKHAESLYARAGAVMEVTRNLLMLEAEDAYLRWDAAAQQVPPARESADTGDQLADDLTNDFIAGSKIKVDEVLNARVLAAQSRATYNDYLYQKILTLAELERITGGGFCAHLSEEGATQRWAPSASK